jgi:oligoribonuclease (3'-5' exoribonuclease)
MLAPFIDVETTDLNEHRDVLLEVGVVVVDMPSGEEIADFRTGIRYADGMLSGFRAQCPERVREMHDKSLLWNWLTLQDNTIALPELDGWLQAIAQLWLPCSPADLPPLCNFNAPFDWRWLNRAAPVFVQKCLHYRVFDLSTLRTSVAMIYPAGFGPQKGEEVHRSVPDCRQAIEYWKWYRAHVMTPYNRQLVES